MLQLVIIRNKKGLVISESSMQTIEQEKISIEDDLWLSFELLQLFTETLDGD